MLSTLLLALLAPAALPAAPQAKTAPAPPQRPALPEKPAAAQRGSARTLGQLRFGDRARRGGVILNGTSTSLVDPFLSIAPTASPGIYELKINGTGTGWQEPFLLGAPPAPLAPAPLLVLFHAFGVTEADCRINTGLMKRAMERGWYVVAPRGAHDVNFAIDYAQQNIECVLDWTLTLLDVDPARIYGVGFSMGGGGAMSFAARHLDPAGARFAALVNHTGTVSVSNAYYNESQAVIDILEDPLMFGGPPSQFPFEYARASVVDLDPVTLLVDPTTDLARNLEQVAIETWSATFDPITYLLDQSDAVHTWLVGLGANAARVQVVSNLHSWRTLNLGQVLDFLQQHTLSVPAEGTHELLADRDARYHHFTVRQDVPGAFTPFRWDLSTALNRLIVDETENLQWLLVDTSSLGLDTSLPLTVVLGTQDGLDEELALDGYAQAPTDVLRNGTSTASWSYDPAGGVVTLFESDAAGYPQWEIRP